MHIYRIYILYVHYFHAFLFESWNLPGLIGRPNALNGWVTSPNLESKTKQTDSLFCRVTSIHVGAAPNSSSLSPRWCTELDNVLPSPCCACDTREPMRRFWWNDTYRTLGLRLTARHMSPPPPGATRTTGTSSKPMVRPTHGNVSSRSGLTTRHLLSRHRNKCL